MCQQFTDNADKILPPYLVGILFKIARFRHAHVMGNYMAGDYFAVCGNQYAFGGIGADIDTKQIFGTHDSFLYQHLTVFKHQAVVQENLAGLPKVFDNIPVDGGLICAAGFGIGPAQGDVNGAADFFIQ